MKTLATMAALVLMMTATIAAPAAASEERPMLGRFSATAAPVAQRCGPDALTLGFEITGVATHVGVVTGLGTNCTEFSLATSAVAIWNGELTLAAADGSTLTTVSDGRQDAPVAGVATFVTTHTVTGGTGRFDGATGIWTVSGTIDFTTGTISGRVSGSLSY